jgi:hypothetical protein
MLLKKAEMAQSNSLWSGAGHAAKIDVLFGTIFHVLDGYEDAGPVPHL